MDKKLLRVGDSVRVFAPATVANMICGFDILGFALETPGDEIEMRLSAEPGVRIISITGDEGKLPRASERNTVSASVQHWLKAIGREEVGFEISLHKGMPIGSGLGSSAASTVAGLFAANYLLGEPVERDALLPFATLGEQLACGNPHADNVAPGLLGGVTLIRSYDPLEVRSLPVPADLAVSVIFPHVEIPTRDARKMIREQVPLQAAVKQWGNIAGLVAGLYESDYTLIGSCMQDVIAEPARSILIPGFEGMRLAALAGDALAFGISGSGPSVFALCKGKETAANVTATLEKYLGELGIACTGYVSRVNVDGPRVLEVNGKKI